MASGEERESRMTPQEDSEETRPVAEETVTLCGASSYEQKYYLNPLFSRLPDDMKDQLKVICVLFTEEIGGSFFMEFDEHAKLQFRTMARESDYNYDEIGAALMIKEIRKSREPFLASLEMFYRVLILGLPMEEE